MVAYSKTHRWIAVEIAADPEAAEAVEDAFNLLDSLGTEINFLPNAKTETVTIVGYFNEPPDDEMLMDHLHYALRIYGLNVEAVKSVEQREFEDVDWLQEWKRHWKPTIIGRFVVAPPWEKVDVSDRIVIRIEPNMAFGTGTHETTQLCLKAIEESYLPGDSFLDIGTGTGILAIATAKLATEGTEDARDAAITDALSLPEDNIFMDCIPLVTHILACDTDSNSIRIARENAEMNSVGGIIEFIDGPIPSDVSTFDFVCANLTIDVILPMVPLLIGKTRKTLVFSGILAEQQEIIGHAMADAEVDNFQIDYSGEWISVKVSIENDEARRKANTF